MLSAVRCFHRPNPLANLVILERRQPLEVSPHNRREVHRSRIIPDFFDRRRQVYHGIVLGRLRSMPRSPPRDHGNVRRHFLAGLHPGVLHFPLVHEDVSSFAVARKITSRFRCAIERFSSMNTARLAASIPLSSMAPRPYMYPSFITPANGSTLHRDLSTGTVSKCATSKSALEDSAIADLCNRATTALRPGVNSSSWALIPSFARTPATYIAAICSFPGGFVVLILMRSVSQPCASLAIAEVLPIGDGLPGIPGPTAGETCAAIGRLAAIANAAAPAMLWTIRFQFTNPSSS